MSKGTPSMGKHNRITHIRCRRCGRHSYHIQKSHCSACGFPHPKMKNESWKWKDVQKTGRKYNPHKHQKKKTSHIRRHAK